jgi:predicted nucleic acid-binding protein
LAPPTFKGTSLKELREFQQGCEVYFDAVDEPDERRRIATAALYLRELALQEWSRRITTPLSWEEFIRFLRNRIADPANRIGTASLRLKKAEQRESQSARQFASYIEELEDISDMRYEERRAWVLLNRLKPEIRTNVLLENRVITTRA